MILSVILPYSSVVEIFIANGGNDKEVGMDVNCKDRRMRNFSIFLSIVISSVNLNHLPRGEDLSFEVVNLSVELPGRIRGENSAMGKYDWGT